MNTYKRKKRLSVADFVPSVTVSIAFKHSLLNHTLGSLNNALEIQEG